VVTSYSTEKITGEEKKNKRIREEMPRIWGVQRKEGRQMGSRNPKVIKDAASREWVP